MPLIVGVESVVNALGGAAATRLLPTGGVGGVALTLWFNVQRTGRPGEELYMNHLFPPQMRAAKAVPI